MEIKQVCVVIPAYKQQLSELEAISLCRNTTLLSRYPIFLVVPRNLNVGNYDAIANCQLNIIRLNSKWFQSLQNYNKLFLSERFYALFDSFRYVLVAQLDSYTFRDELSHWCETGYSYVGAPWPDGLSIRPRSFRGCMKVGDAFLDYVWNAPEQIHVGNGGFSLRNIQDTRTLLQNYWKRVAFWHYNEDYFYSYAGAKLDGYTTPSFSEALQFGFEQKPSMCFRLSNYRLPFGCHAWAKYEPEFYRSFIPCSTDLL